MPERVDTYAAALLAGWFSGKTGRACRLARAVDGAAPVYIAEGDGESVALAIVRLWDTEPTPAAEARAFMEERLTGGLVRGPFMLWVPPRAAVPSQEPAASDFVQRVQQAAGPVAPGQRAEFEMPVRIQIAKMRDEGGYASVIGGLSRWWTLITERVDGTFNVNSAKMRRAPQDAAMREALFDRIGEVSKRLRSGEATEIDAFEAWTVQRLAEDPLGERGFAIVQGPPNVDPTDGTLMRRLVRKRMKEASAALAGVEAGVKGVGLVAIYEYAEHETVGSFIKSLDPSLFAGAGLIAAIVDGEVRPIFMPR